MHIDLEQSRAAAGQPAGSPAGPQTFSSSICILGGGIAGLILATRLADRGIDVDLLEAGGLDWEERSQALYAAENAAAAYTGAAEGRFRTLGGSSTRWGGQLLPFTGEVFSPLPGMPSRPWPVSEDDLLPFYEAVQELFGVDRLPFDRSLLPALGHPSVPLPPEISLRFSKWAPFARRNLAQTLGPGVVAHRSIRLFTHANCIALEGQDGRIVQVRVRDYAGGEFRFRAKHFIVAAGSIESSRLLLNSPAVPNPHDQLGRYFNDHLAFHAGQLRSPARETVLRRLGPYFVDGTLHTCKLTASAETRAQTGSYEALAHFVIAEPDDSGTAAVRNLLRSLQAGRIRSALAENLLPMLRGAGDIVRLAYYARFKRRRAVSSRAAVVLSVDIEQSPNPENRIRLSASHDALGVPRAIVDWRPSTADFATAKQFARQVRAALASLGISSIAWHPCLDDTSEAPLVDTYHAMGGLCMGEDPASSVVDRNLKLHQVENLHVASCAVFPSGSSSNPTFTMMALTMRLADHLAAQLEPRPGAPSGRSGPSADAPAPER